jgi:hypothetical protein
MTARISIITHVYNAQQGIDFQTRIWRSYPARILDQLEFIVIDDHSDPPLKIDKDGLSLRHFWVDDDLD